MLEGVVHQVLLGYLGRYVKDFSKDQVKVTLWNIEVELKDIELILEAFDYLQLPFALKQGRVGRLSIKVPWNLIGGEPILIALENVFFSASPRDDHEWKMDAVEARELAGKKAKLAAAELAKLSRRVSDNKGGWSFIPYVTTKVLENIQVSVRNFHVLYSDKQSISEEVLFGLRFSSLTMSKQNPAGLRTGQVGKIVEIEGLEIYCTISKEDSNILVVKNIEDSKPSHSGFVGDKSKYILEPVNISLSLLVNRSGKLNDLPQYTISAKITCLVLSLNETQLQQILILSDYLRTSQLREKYGRYRPWSCPLSRKKDGWQRLWWRYAQESILSDVHQKLKKTSWRYLGQRLSNRRKYVNLYKTKLEFLRQDLAIDESIVRELEQMEKECDIDDILSYRSVAEKELQEVLSKSLTANISIEKSRQDGQLSGKSRGWLNWLSRGMLGAGGTDDSSQFSGVVSDEDVQDIFEATKFYPPVLSGVDADTNDKIHTRVIECSIDEISATLWSINFCLEIAKLNLHEGVIKCNLQEELVTVIAFVESGEMVNSSNEQVIRLMSSLEKNVGEDLPLYRVQADFYQKRDVELSVNVMLQSLEVAYEAAFFQDLMEFFSIIKSFEFQHERVMSSLDEIEDVKSRILAKAEYILSGHKKVAWDVNITNITINIPLRNAVSEEFNMVFELGSLLFASKPELDSLSSSMDGQSFIQKNTLDSSFSEWLTSFQLQHLYNYFETELLDFEVKLMKPNDPQAISIVKKFGASITFASCIIPNESRLKQLEVYVAVSSFDANFSIPIYESVVALIVLLRIQSSRSESFMLEDPNSLHTMSSHPGAPRFGFTITANIKSANFLVDLANNGENSSSLTLAVNNLDVRYSLVECERCWICLQAMDVTAHTLSGKRNDYVLCSFGNLSASNTENQYDMAINFGDASDNLGDIKSTEACFLVHYEADGNMDFVCHKFTVHLNDAEIHCYPHIFGLLAGFYDRLCSSSPFIATDNSSLPAFDGESTKNIPVFQFQRFGFSNFTEVGTSDYASISVDCFPFVTINNSGSLGSLESSLRHSTHDWRKLFHLRDKKFRSPNYSLKKETKHFHPSPLKSKISTAAFPVSTNANVYAIDINLSGIKLHFHDSSCIVGTITLPSSKSSLCIYDDFMDLVSSSEGVILTSSWWTNNLNDFLWGPLLPNLSPILNIRVRKGVSESLSSQLEFSFGIQHTYCILPSEYLAIIIGYFSLDDWSSNSSVQPVSKNIEKMDNQSENDIIYKFEVLESTWLLPIESDKRQFLRTEIQQLCGSFINECAFGDVFKDIPPECLVLENKVARRNHCLNMFGRDLSLSFMLFEDDCLTFVPGTEPRNFSLIAPFGADVWIRIPIETNSVSGRSSDSTCVMSRITVCQVLFDDFYFIGGFEALLEIIDQFSFLMDESRSYSSNVLQFLQLKRFRKESRAVSPECSSMTFTEVKCLVESLSIQFNRIGEDCALLEPVAKAEMSFSCCVSLINDTPISLDLSLFSLALWSLLNLVILARCTNKSTLSALDLTLSESAQGQSEFHICLPSLEIWVHCSDWTEVLDLYDSCMRKVEETAKLDSSSRTSAMNMICPVQDESGPAPQISVEKSGASTCDVPLSSVMEDTVVLIVRSENIGITFHFALHVTGEASGEFVFTKEGPQNVLSTGLEGKCCKLLTLMTHSKSTELVISGKNVKFKCILEKTSGTLGFQGDEFVNSWPFFQICQVNVETQIFNFQEKPLHLNLGVQCDRLDVWLSHQVFFFLHDVWFDIPGSSSSQNNFGIMELKVQLRKGSLLLSDGRWNCSGPLLEILPRNFLLHANMTQNILESAVACDLQVNYNNIHKVFWEPFIEPWKFEMCILRKQELNALLDNSVTTDIHLLSTEQLNFNFTEPLIETVFRTVEMVKDACGFAEQDASEKQRFLNPQLTDNISGGRSASYILENLTSLPLVYRVYQGLADSDMFDFSKESGQIVQPGASVPIYLHDTPVEQLFRYRPTHSSDNLSERQSDIVSHHLMTIELDGMSVPSAPVSMDLVGLTYFEVDFSNTSRYNVNMKENGADDAKNGFVVPVVLDVSMQRYSKLIRLYSTVMILNTTSMPLELRFDIPFGIAPKILDPIYPGQEFPLPLHLAEAGRMRWRPLGDSYLWSEAHNLSDLLSLESKIGFLRSFVCYPSHPSSDPFRCCLSLQHISLPAADKPKKSSLNHVDPTLSQSRQSCNTSLSGLGKSTNRFIHQMTLSTPLVINNYLPESISLTVESGGITRTALLSKVATFFHHVDLSHDVILEFSMPGYRPSVTRFPRTETFSTTAKFSGTKFCQSETVTFDPDTSKGPIYVTMEKMMDAFSGARELFIYVPFLLYNCTAFSLIISEFTNEMDKTVCTLPSCYYQVDDELFQGRKDGLSLLINDQHSYVGAPQNNNLGCSFMKDRIASTRKTVDLQCGRFFKNRLTSFPHKQTDQHDLVDKKNSPKFPKNQLCSSTQLLSENNDFIKKEFGMVKPCIYSPHPIPAASEILVCLGSSLQGHISENMPNPPWSGPFPLVPPSGSTTVLVRQPSSNETYVLSVTSSAIAGPLAGRTRAITFQPRYLISNACSKDLYYKQKGTDIVYRLSVGQHSQLHWTDTTRELLISIRFDEPGWQWSGSFLPDHLGDTQVKIRNYASGAMNMIRVEVQNADVSIRDEKIVGSLQGNSGTNLILLSEDDTGYMPYRIDNFTMERLRIYQQRCESLDTIVQPYNSCPYAWDEPCYPHRVTVEVPGERVVGSFPLDDLKEYIPVRLQSTSEKPERILLLSVRAEGATKVLSIIDSTYHILKDKEQSAVRLQEKQKQEKPENSVDYKEKFSLTIPCIGISFVNSYPQELLFVSAKNIKIDLLQSMDHQKLYFHISSLQIDNQLHNTPYPVILSFNNDYRSNQVGQITEDDGAKSKAERGLSIPSDSSFEPVFYLAAAKWRKRDVSLVSFEYISLRVADFRLELEQEVILSLLYFFKAVSPGFQSGVLTFSDPIYTVGFVNGQTSEHVKAREQVHGIGASLLSKSDEIVRVLPFIVPIGAPWQQIHLLARRQRKIYVESFYLAPIKFTLSFSSSPWMLRNGVLTSGESLIHRGLMALADVEGARIYLKQFSIMHQMASWESIQEILVRHYMRQLLHEMYKVFGSAGVIGNPMGFARSLGVGIRDFLAVPAKSILKSPTGLFTGMAQGTTSLLSNTVYALSDAATQFSKAAHKGIVAFTFDDQAVARMEKQLKGEASHSKGIINEVFEGLTGLLQSPVKEAEKHGLPGIFSGIALGVTGLVGRPAASILEVTGKTAQSIRNRSRLYHMGSHRYRVRLPRPLSRELPLRPYSWEEAVGVSVLMEADDGRLKDEVYVMCKALKQPGKFVIVTERLVLVVNCPSLVDFAKPEFRGVAADPEWAIETETSLHSVIHTDTDGRVVHIVGSSSDALLRQKQQLSWKGGGRRKRWSNPSTPLPLFQTNLELASEEDAGVFLRVLLSAIEQGKEQGNHEYLLHRNNIK